MAGTDEHRGPDIAHVREAMREHDEDNPRTKGTRDRNPPLHEILDADGVDGDEAEGLPERP
jgi:hypothetical protein